MKFPSITNFLPTFGRSPQPTKQNNALARYLSKMASPFQFARLKHDAASWREAIMEMELAFYPHRVKAQRIFIDTVINPHVHACITRMKDIVLLKEFGLYSGETLDEKSTELFKAEWFSNFISYSLEYDLYGYTLIELGDLVNNSFPNLRLLQRENISPDRETFSSIVYQISGENFNDPSYELYNWYIWLKSPAEKGGAACGYGLLYKIALLEIFLRNLLGSNANYNDNYGQPVRHAKTAKTEGKEYDELCKMLDDMGENAWIVTDLQDEIEFIQAQTGNGAGFKTYENFEARLEKKISKVLLGHADALDSTPGKLGGNSDGEESPAAKALEDLETKKSKFIENAVNNQLIPKLIQIGFPVKPGLVFRFKNDKEEEEVRQKADASLTATATAVKTFFDAGMEVDEAWLNKYTGVPMKRKAAPEPVNNDPKMQEKISNFYNL